MAHRCVTLTAAQLPPQHTRTRMPIIGTQMHQLTKILDRWGISHTSVAIARLYLMANLCSLGDDY